MRGSTVRRLVAASALICVTMLLSKGNAAAQIGPGITGVTTPNAQVQAGQTITVEFRGFAPNIEVVRWVAPPFGAPSIPFPSDVITDANGTVAWHYTVPNTAQVGSWAVVARAKYAPVGTRGTPAFFRVVASSTTPTVGASVVPTIGKIGTRFTFQVPGLTNEQPIYAWANGPNGENIDLRLNIRADTSGTATWSWTVPTGTATGAWRMIVRDSATIDDAVPPRELILFTIE